MMLYLVSFFIIGLVFGSFANVCIARIPKGESIITPSSHCTKCGKHIDWYDNLPIISYALLKAKCRHCKEEISMQYPLVEFVTGVVFVILAWKFQGNVLLPVYLLFMLILLIISVIDFYNQIIPDSLSLTILVLGLFLSPFNADLGTGIKSRIINSVAGILLGGGTLLLIGFVAKKIMGKEAMGGGDIKLLGAIGAVLGWAKIFPVLFIASVIGSVFGLFLILTKRIERTGYIPFGPFLSLSAFFNIFLPNIVAFMVVLRK